jgi:heat shock protein HslJ
MTGRADTPELWDGATAVGPAKYAGCNCLGGRADQDGDRVIVNTFGTTDIGCAPDLVDQDEWLTKFLTSSRPDS